MNGVILSGKKWEWKITGCGNFETIHFAKEVVNLQESDVPLKENTKVTLSQLRYEKLEISLSEMKVGEGFEI